MKTYKLNFTEDSKNILQTLLDDELTLRYLTFKPNDANDDVTIITQERPSLLITKTYEQRFSEYYLSEDPYLINWQLKPNPSFQKGLISFYPNITSFKNYTARSQYAFDIYLPYSWHKLNNCCYHVVKRMIDLFLDQDIFGNFGKINVDRIRPIRDMEGYAGYRINFYQHNL